MCRDVSFTKSGTGRTKSCHDRGTPAHSHRTVQQNALTFLYVLFNQVTDSARNRKYIFMAVIVLLDEYVINRLFTVLSPCRWWEILAHDR